MTLAAAPEAWQGAMAAGLLGMGSWSRAVPRSPGRYLGRCSPRPTAEGDLEPPRASLEALKAARQKVPGLGHPQHSTGDPRANKLLRSPTSSASRAAMSRRCARSGGTRRASWTGRCRSTSRAPSRRDPRCRMAARRDQGMPLLARAAGLSRISGGIAALDRLHHVPPRRHGHLLRRQALSRQEGLRRAWSRSSRIRVVEMGTYITGPAAAMHLADLGADVIKVERPGTGDPFRAFKGGLYSPHYQTYNRNKRSIALDTKDPGRPRGVPRSGPPPPTCSSRTSAPASPTGSAPARKIAGAEPEADLLRHLGLRPHRPGTRPAGLRHRRAGRVRLSAPADAAREAARHRPGHRRCAHRPVRRAGHPRRAARARDTGKGRRIDISMLEAMATSTSTASRTTTASAR
jgi:hypothetical protein